MNQYRIRAIHPDENETIYYVDDYIWDVDVERSHIYSSKEEATELCDEFKKRYNIPVFVDVVGD